VKTPYFLLARPHLAHARTKNKKQLSQVPANRITLRYDHETVRNPVR
jgi:hypothetical protein